FRSIAGGGENEFRLEVQEHCSVGGDRGIPDERRRYGFQLPACSRWENLTDNRFPQWEYTCRAEEFPTAIGIKRLQKHEESLERSSLV
ncbi:unnamed protein product, partial [Ectocarpus sp. 12 AP-2014]